MVNWILKVTDKYEKKHPKIFKALINNFDYYFDALNRNVAPQKILVGFVHGGYPHGIKSIDQSRSGEKLKETRLYIYPDTKERTLHLITIGDKGSQHEDVKFCDDYVKKIL